jgi:hypothetical protein
MSAGIGFERLPILNGSELRMVSRDGLACDLAQIVSQPIFDIPRLVKASRDQRLDPLLGCGSSEGSDARIPPGAELDVRRQAGVD